MDIAERIRTEVEGWEGVTARPHRFGGVAFMLGKRELGHIHGDRLADLPFPKRVAEELIADGKALPHHVVRDSGWVSKPIRGEEDVEAVLDLFRLSYDRAIAATARRAKGSDPLEAG
ncbi:MAG: luciferase family protein [Gaiellaceae bacterium]